ncbi:hypothetical protein [Foetidibacter luteolus]|uniref:hypothetical protein n=1 Tax=Foetidibacter luteolus TaxID=2608880 RepID=UPI00129BE1F7|nr:hypothetical protein [Foetidibacter luteolus]
MKRILLIFVLSFFSFQLYAQVGLLSSNNKNSYQKAPIDSIHYPSLIITKTLGAITPVSDTASLIINYFNQNEQRIDSLKDVVNKQDTRLYALQNTYDDVAKELNGLKALSKEEKKKKMQEITNLTERLDQLQKDKDQAINMINQLSTELGHLVAKSNSFEALNKELISQVINSYAIAYNEKLSTQKKKVSNLFNDLYKNQYNINSYWFLIDSNKQDFDKGKFLDTLSDIYSKIRILADDNNITQQILTKAVQQLNTLKDSSQKISINDLEEYAKLKNKWNHLALDTTLISKSLLETSLNLEKTIELYNQLLKNNIKNKQIKESSAKTTDFGAFPQLTSVLGKKEIIPQLQLYGSYNYENNSTSFEGNIGLSFAASGNADTGNIHDIFLPSASKFLVYSNFNYSFWSTNQSNSRDKDSAKRIALKLSFGFAGKNLVFDTAKTINAINSTMLYAKAGLELGILPKRFSIYANVNTVSLMDKVDQFNMATGIDSKFFGYIDCGARFFLDPAPQAKIDLGLYIYSDINFIVNGGDVKRLTKTNDLVIPSIQIGIVKRLGRL